MEERRTNKHGLGFTLSVRREKFGHSSDILYFCVVTSVYSNKIPTKLPGSLTHPLALADPASGSTGP